MASIFGTSGDDRLEGTPDADTIETGGGADVVNGNGGDDIIDESEGVALGSTITGGDGDDLANLNIPRAGSRTTLDGGAGTDTLIVDDFIARSGGTPYGLFWLTGAAPDGAYFVSAEYNGRNLGVAFTNVEVVVGSDYGDAYFFGSATTPIEIRAGGGLDYITGTQAADVLRGGGSGDSIEGGGGADAYYGEDGDDLLTLRSMPAVVDGGAGDDSVAVEFEATVDLRARTITLGEVTVELVSVETVRASKGTLLGTDGADSIFNQGQYTDGRGGDDHLVGFGTLLGGDGDDTLDSYNPRYSPPLTLDGGEGADTLRGGENADTLIGGAGADTLGGGRGSDLLEGGEENDALYGGSGHDRVFGGAGDDIFVETDSLSHDDQYDGGPGIDAVQYASGVFADLAAGFARPNPANTSQPFVGNDSLTGIENLEGSRSSLTFEYMRHSDVLLGDDGPNQIRGNGGADVLDGRGGDDVLDGTGSVGRSNFVLTSYLFGRDGNDTLIGGVEGEILDGGDGDDVATGNFGADWLSGGSGNDSLSGGDLDDILSGGTGINFISGGNGRDLLDYTGMSERLYVDLTFGYHSSPAAYDFFVSVEGVIGGDSDDQLLGTGGEDTLIGGGGNDVLRGREGDDLLTGGAGIDDLYGDDGLDLVDYSAETVGLYVDLLNGAYSTADDYDRFTGIEGLVGGSGRDFLLGIDEFDVLDGRMGDDVLIGRGGDDFLFGGDGADWIIGGPGSDNVSGGAGADVFDLNGGGWDTVADFDHRAGDRIHLGGRSFQHLREEDANGDGVLDSRLVYDGGDFVVLGVSGLHLFEWNALLV